MTGAASTDDANGNRPSTGRLSEAVEASVRAARRRYEPDQIILFGSTARGENGPGSDVDLMVIVPDGRGPGADAVEREEWPAGKGNESGSGQTFVRTDIILTERECARRNKNSTTRIHGAAFADGVTVYARPGTEPLPTGAEYVEVGGMTIKKTSYEPEKAARDVERADLLADQARNTGLKEGELAAQVACEGFQESIEFSLKALITAHGERVPHTHNLERLRDEAEKLGEKIRAQKNGPLLRELSPYAGRRKYEAGQPSINPRETARDAGILAIDMLNHAKARVPEFCEATTARNKAAEAAPAAPGPERTDER